MGTTFSMPMTVISVSGRVRHIRPLPSLSTTASVPVSATREVGAADGDPGAQEPLAQVGARAAMARPRGSSVSVSGRRRASRAAKISRISARFRWIAGTRMCDGLSSPSWTMSSARSVSCAVMPAASSASLRPISWVAIDLTLTTSSAPVARTSSSDDRVGLGRVAGPVHRAAAGGDLRSSSIRCSSRRAIVAALMAGPASRSSSQSGTSPTTAARLPRIVRGRVAEVGAQLGVAQRVAGGVREATLAAQVPDRGVGGAAAGDAVTRHPAGRCSARGSPSRRAREDLGEVDGAARPSAAGTARRRCA